MGFEVRFIRRGKSDPDAKRHITYSFEAKDLEEAKLMAQHTAVVLGAESFRLISKVVIEL